MGTVLLDVKDIMKTLKLGRSTVLKLLARGDIRPIKIGRSLRIHPDEVTRYLQELHDVQHPPQAPEPPARVRGRRR